MQSTMERDFAHHDPAQEGGATKMCSRKFPTVKTVSARHRRRRRPARRRRRKFGGSVRFRTRFRYDFVFVPSTSV